MKNSILLVGLLLSFSRLASAQITVEVKLEQEQFLGGETLPVAVRIANHSGQTLRLGENPRWLTFVVESQNGFIVRKTGEVPVQGEFTLESSKVATKRVDLAPYFELTRPGQYRVTANVQIKDWANELASSPKAFDIVEGAKLWSQEFGLPLRAGETNQLPEVRRYTLQQANYLRTQLRLYFRLTDAAGSRVLKVFSIGPLVSFSRPEAQVDSSSNLHVLYQSGPRDFSYTAINPDGEIITRQTYSISNTRPRLQPDAAGKISVAGGVRKVTSTDIPASQAGGEKSKTLAP